MATSDSEDFESADEDFETTNIRNQDNKTVQDVKRKHIDSSKIADKSTSHINHSDASKATEKPPLSNVSKDVSDPAKSVEISNETEKVKANKESLHASLDRSLKISKECVGSKSEKESHSENQMKKPVISEVCEKRKPGEELEGWEDDLDDLGDVEDELEEVTQEKKPSGEVKIGSVLDRLTMAAEKEDSGSGGGGWGSWGSWGVTSLLSTATESVSTLTNHVSQGLNTVLEAGLGVPSPEELARQDHEREQALLAEQNTSEQAVPESEEERPNDGAGLFGLGRVMSGVTSITKLVETAGTKVVTGGLDTLETIGKKTMEVLQEGDPGLKKKRAFFNSKILLSQVLREAKERAEEEDKLHKDKIEARKAHFETLFDDYQGLVHLEALEMLSKQCDLKLQSILLAKTGLESAQLQQALDNLKDECQLPEEDDSEEPSAASQREKLAGIGKGLGVPVASEKLLKTWDETEQWLETCQTNFKSPPGDVKIPTPREIHQKAMGTLARLTAESVEQFHKAAELLLVLEERKPSDEVSVLLDMTSVLCSQVSSAATRFSECLNACPENSGDSETINALITNIFLEAGHSSSYIQEAFHLLVPVLQVGIVKS